MTSISIERSLKNAWNQMIRNAYLINPTGKGLEKWQEFKAILNKYDNTSHFIISGKILKLVDDRKINYNASKFEDSDAKITIGTETFSNENTEQHFLVQLFRLSKLSRDTSSSSSTTPPYMTLTKLMQIAYNIGQFEAVRERDDDKRIYSTNVREFYIANKLNKMSTYVDIDRSIINKQMDDLVDVIGHGDEGTKGGGCANYRYYTYLKSLYYGSHLFH
jgi:hypothetical protein